MGDTKSNPLGDLAGWTRTRPKQPGRYFMLDTHGVEFPVRVVDGSRRGHAVIPDGDYAAWRYPLLSSELDSMRWRVAPNG